MLEHLINYEVTFLIDGVQTTGEVISCKDGWIKMRNADGITFIQVNKVSCFKIKGVIDVHSKLKLYICKNEMTKCSGMKCLSAKELTANDMSCPIEDKSLCNFGCFNSFNKIPFELAERIYDGLMTKCPLK